jgi:hypothetical protein
MKTVNTIEIGGSTYVIPAGISQAKLIEVAGLLLMLQRIEYCSDRQYRKSFYFVEQENARIRLGTQTVYETEEAANAARDAHNAALEPVPVTE